MQKFEGGIVLDKPDEINAFRLLALKGALKLESIGLKSRLGSALKTIKAEFGFKGNAKKVLPLYEAKLREMGILQTPATTVKGTPDAVSTV